VKVLALALALLAPLQLADDAVQGVVQDLRSPGLDKAMRFATDIGKPPTVLGLLLAVAVFGGPAGVETARLAVLTLAPTNLLVEGLKHGVGRPRPDGDAKRSNSSMPSSHAANAFALAAVLGRRRVWYAIPIWALAALVGFSRVYLNRHYLSDVLVGALIGVVCAWAVARLMESRGRKARKT
jgi:undecaprenyl-diphosphatase